ncbi:MAG: heavy metal-binding domain-containing protein [Immundisolibacteraceae bacterium]|nr:heavy metal-binding domain-containing protein [Immundisolibacteraceae bacterium]
MVELLIFLVLISVGYFFGQRSEAKHFRSIRARELELMGLITHNGKHPLGVDQLGTVTESRLVYGSVVISVDYFKGVVAGLRMLVGGNLGTYETLVDRARREAVLRLKESCTDAAQIINLRIETSAISKGNQNQVGSVEVLAYATAIYTQ